MRKVVGWILMACGILSLPGFLSKLPTAHDGYELIGMLIGQGLIYFFAYLCLRNKSKCDTAESITSPIKKENIMESTTADNSFYENTNVDDEVNDLLETSLAKDLEAEGIHYDTKNIIESYKTNEKSESVVKKEVPSCIVDNQKESTIDKEESPKQSPEFPQIKYNNISWKEIFDLIYTYQRDELQTKSNPSNFMVPYDHDKIAIANDVLRLSQNSTKFEELRRIRSLASEIGISIDCTQLFTYLSVICSPINFMGKEEEFKMANDFYGRILQAKNNIDALEDILMEARSLGLGIPLEIIPENTDPKKLPLKTKILICIIALWEGAAVFMLAYKGVLYNAKDYFFPFQTCNIAKYDYTEFLFYGIIVPVLVTGVIAVSRITTKNKFK